MKGHIRKRGNSWAIVLEIRDPVTGVRKRKWHSYSRSDGTAATRKEAEAECRRLLTELEGGAYIDPTKETIATFLNRWLAHMQGQVSPRSHERYAELCRKNIAPLLGGLSLTKLQPAHISQAYAKALTSGRRDGQGGLSARTVHHMHRVLRQALQQAVEWQMLTRNPADLVKPPEGRAQADADPRRRWDGRADRGGAGDRPIRPGPARRALRAAPWRGSGVALAVGRS